MSELTWTKAINKVLSSSTMPLHYNEITERIISDGLRKNLGATPSATVNAKLAVSIKHDGDSSPYIRVSKGTFAMRSQSSNAQTVSPKLTPEITESEEQYEVITSFGMFWRKEAIEWKATPKLLGMQQIGAIPVDFNKQLGIYLLYDGREVIYVGRSTERPLGKMVVRAHFRPLVCMLR
ncbi:MAG: winged helix-turn-helix domain-containing protein [Ghiorsea sp.]|nr:winged helix-turn-helix domain-containing protein [Ghiorsea sp.]